MNQNTQKSHHTGGQVLSYKELLKWEARELAKIMGIKPSNELRPLANQIKQLHSIDESYLMKTKMIRRFVHRLRA